MIGPRELVIFIAIGAAPILIATGIGYYYFCRWARQEKEKNRQFVDAHVAEVMRNKPDRND